MLGAICFHEEKLDNTPTSGKTITDLHITMKNVICMQIIKCHEELYKPFTEHLLTDKWKNKRKLSNQNK